MPETRKLMIRKLRLEVEKLGEGCLLQLVYEQNKRGRIQ